MYKVERHIAEIPVTDYIKDYVNIAEFIERCKECPNYNQIWACPDFDFDPIEYWTGHETLRLIAEDIIFDEEYANKKFSEKEIKEIINDSIRKVRAELTEELYEMERKAPGAVSLSGGSCRLCEVCARSQNLPCIHPEKMRYSIEALGGNVGMTIEKLMGLKIEWVKDNLLPSHFVLVCGLLI